MKKPQWITIAAAIVLVVVIYRFGRTTPRKETGSSVENPVHTVAGSDLTDSILIMAKRQIKPEQALRITTLESSISRGAVKEQQLKIYRQLADFWRDSAGIFLPYAWYEAESARLENSEKSLTFAARLFLDGLQQEQNDQLRKWEALQARDLFERSLTINPGNDSARVGLGACYLFGNISAAPMEGILKIREVLNKDSTNVYAQMMLVKGSLLSGQYDKAISRLELINKLQPGNLEAILMLADAYERTDDRANAVNWYRRSLNLVERADLKAAIEKRIQELSK